jgi:hypothetical protein
MTETVWLTGADPGPMLEYLAGRASARKLRLAACACCRRDSALLSDRRVRAAVEAAERFAEGLLDADGLTAAETAANAAALEEAYFLMPAAVAAVAATAESAPDALRLVLRCYLSKAERDAVYECALPSEQAAAVAAARAQEGAVQCALLREVFGNPFRPPTLEPALRRWNDGCVVRLAQTIHDRRRWDELPILADALADAGCRDEALLAHCTAAREHALGCWALDALLEKE